MRARVAPDAADDDGFHWQTSLPWKQGDQRLDPTLGTPCRIEWWDVNSRSTEALHLLDTRMAAKLGLEDQANSDSIDR